VAHGALKHDGREDFDLVLAACLTLLGLVIAFSFAMAMNRYDMRKNYEEAEANAIVTEYVRTDLLPDETSAVVRGQLRHCGSGAGVGAAVAGHRPRWIRHERRVEFAGVHAGGLVEPDSACGLDPDDGDSRVLQLARWLR
jgi:hypothetical protein